MNLVIIMHNALQNDPYYASIALALSICPKNASIIYRSLLRKMCVCKYVILLIDPCAANLVSGTQTLSLSSHILTRTRAEKLREGLGNSFNFPVTVECQS